MSIYRNSNGTAELFANVGGGSGGGKAEFDYHLQDYLTISSDISASFIISSANAIHINGITRMQITLKATADVELTSLKSIATLKENAPDYMWPMADDYARISATDAIITDKIYKNYSNPTKYDWRVFFNHPANEPWNEFKIEKINSSSGSISVTTNESLILWFVFFNNAS